MKLHLINGFLGSGKTTAIITATRSLLQQGKSIGIVTNDKGKFQVDTAFYETNHIPTRQVSGGCFRCSFSEFEEMIGQLQSSTSPEVIFAESVGSCVDLVNTIFSPIRQNSDLKVDETTYSVFSDIRLFRLWINNEPLPFSERVNYLFAKQIEESKLLILNKCDLFPAQGREEIFTAAMERFPDKTILLQDSQQPSSVLAWLEALAKEPALRERPGFSVDYPIYKGGENEMAWLDQIFIVESQEPARIKPAVMQLIYRMLSAVREGGFPVGHIKFLISSSGVSRKISFTTADFLEDHFAHHWGDMIPEASEGSLTLMLNARLSMQAEDFSKIVENAVRQVEQSAQICIRIQEGSSYNPEMSMHRP